MVSGFSGGLTGRAVKQALNFFLSTGRAPYHVLSTMGASKRPLLPFSFITLDIIPFFLL